MSMRTKETFFHEEYSVTFGDDWNTCLYDKGAIETITLNSPKYIDKSPNSVTVTVTDLSQRRAALLGDKVFGS